VKQDILSPGVLISYGVAVVAKLHELALTLCESDENDEHKWFALRAECSFSVSHSPYLWHPKDPPK
jgi:hypothetical protein